MIIIEDNKILDNNTVVALGNFDGVHIGHKELLLRAKKRAVEIGRELVVITFNEKLTQKKNKGIDCKIMSFKQKCRVLENMGVDILYILDFNQELRDMSREDFVNDILINKVLAEEIFIGFNFRFGRNAEGDASYLKNGGFDFKVNIIDAVQYKNRVVSSSLIREYIKKGQIEDVNDILIVPFTVSGKVIRGKGRGKNLGFATANLKCDDKYINPKFGVYETKTIYKGRVYKSLTNVGENPTFGDIDLFSIETHLLDFDDDIYDETIDVEFVRFMRGEVKFTTVTNLITQVKSDISSILFAKEKKL